LLVHHGVHWHQHAELRLAEGAQRNFYRIADEGIQKARAVNDPILKAHLEYQRRLDSSP
jgi:hypothetical protein